jgi:hypothetical protein
MPISTILTVNSPHSFLVLTMSALTSTADYTAEQKNDAKLPQQLPQIITGQ